MGAGVLVLVLLVLGGVLFTQHQQRQAELAHAAELERQGAAAATTVDGFFASIAEGSAGTALNALAAAPESASLLTDEVLAASADEAPVEATPAEPVTVSEDYQSATVGTTVTVGDDTADWELGLARNGDVWTITDDLPTVRADMSIGDTPVEINGVEVGIGAELPAFPGVYQVGTGSDRIAYDTDSVTVLDQGQTAWSGQPELTDSGREFVIDRARQSLDDCQASQELAPDGCPMNVAEGADQSIDAASIERDVNNDPFDGDLQIDLVMDGASIPVELDWNFTADGTVGGQAATFSRVGNEPQSFNVLVTAFTGDDPEVVWFGG